MPRNEVVRSQTLTHVMYAASDAAYITCNGVLVCAINILLTSTARVNGNCSDPLLHGAINKF